MNRIIVLIFAFAFAQTNVSAQLGDKAIEQIAQKKADKWALYLGLSNNRKAKLKTIFEEHEERKSKIIFSTTDIEGLLAKENQNLLKGLSRVLTHNEIDVYQLIEKSDFKDDKEHLTSLVNSITSDSLYIKSYMDLQYFEILPTLLQIRMELESKIKTKDKLILDSIRTEVFELYDQCLLTCLSDDHVENSNFHDFDDLLIVTINKDLSDKQSGLSQLVALSQKYEEDIHALNIKYREKHAYWNKRNRQLKEKHILPNYVKNLVELKTRNEVKTLQHIESDAIFFLLDPFDHPRSRKFLNLSLHNQL